MFNSESRVRATTPGRYLRQLCNHWRHKFPVTREAEQRGRIELPAGACELEAAADELVVRITGPVETEVVRLEQVVAEHLQRFALDERLVFEWVRGRG